MGPISSIMRPPERGGDQAAATAVLLQSSSSGFCHRSIGDVNNDGYDDVDYSYNCGNSPEIMYGAPDFASNGFTATQA